MYYFKQDTKSTRSMLAIRDALVRCMRTKRFHDITITDLSKESHVSRVTFYRFFATTTDVLEYLCDSVFEEAATDFRFVDRDKHDEYVRFLLDYLMKRSRRASADTPTTISLTYPSHSRRMTQTT